MDTRPVVVSGRALRGFTVVGEPDTMLPGLFHWTIRPEKDTARAICERLTTSGPEATFREQLPTLLVQMTYDSSFREIDTSDLRFTRKNKAVSQQTSDAAGQEPPVSD